MYELPVLPVPSLRAAGSSPGQAGFCTLPGVHKAGSVDLQGLEGREGAEQQIQAGREVLLLPRAAQWPSGVGEVTFQDQVKLLQLRGGVVPPDFTVSGKMSQY